MIDYEIPSDSHHYLLMLYIPSGGPTFWDPEALTVMVPPSQSATIGQHPTVKGICCLCKDIEGQMVDNEMKYHSCELWTKLISTPGSMHL
jgi:hypothetical protein